MKREQELREILIHNTVRLVAEGGFEKATTKAITFDGETLPDMRMNEVYIYRIFGNKEHLYEAAFECLDEEFAEDLQRCVEYYRDASGCVRERLCEVFLRVWRFAINNETQCRFYIRYYYSIYFKGQSLAGHNQRFSEIVNCFRPLFKDEADVVAIMHSVLTLLLDFANRVYNGDLADDDINRPHIYNVLYCAMESYFAEEVRKSANLRRFV